MKESMWGYYLVLLGITVSVVMIMVSNMTTTNQQNYYLLKEVTNAAMIDSVDFSYYREYGTIKINTEKFVENFLRRFSEGISKMNTYKIEFYSIYENPPSVSIKVTSNTGDYNIAGDQTNIDVVNTIDAIVEANNIISHSEVFYSVPYASCNVENYITTDEDDIDAYYCQLTNRVELNLDDSYGESYIINEIKKNFKTDEILDKNKIKIANVEFLSVMSTQEDLKNYNDMYKSMYNREGTIYDVPKELGTSNYLAKDIKDVKITLKKDDDKYYLAYGLKFKCDETYDYYRKGTTVSNMDYKTEIEYNNLTDKTGYEKAPFYDNCLVGIKYKVDFYYDD